MINAQSVFYIQINLTGFHTAQKNFSEGEWNLKISAGKSSKVLEYLSHRSVFL